MSDRKWGQLFMPMQVHLSSEKSSMLINTHGSRLDMEWKYLTMRTETGCWTKTEWLFKTWSTQDDPSKVLLPSRLQKSQGRVVLKTLAMEEKSKDYRIVLGCVLQYVRGSQSPRPGKEGLPLWYHLSKGCHIRRSSCYTWRSRELARWPRHSKDNLRRGVLAYSLPSQERCKACKRKGCWLIACPSHNGCEQKEQDRKETRLSRMQIDHLYYRPKSQDRVPRTMDNVPWTAAGCRFRAKKDDRERRRRWSIADGQLNKRTKTTLSKEIMTTEQRKMIWKQRNMQPNDKCVKKEQDRAQLTYKSSHPNCLGG